MSKTYYLFRHGETYFSKNELPYGEHELTAEILPESRPIIKKMADHLAKTHVDRAMRSEFFRCAQTVEIIQPVINIPFTFDSLLNEFTETDFDEFHKRMTALTEKLKNLPESKIAICSHGAVIAGLRKLLLRHEFHPHDLMYYPKTGRILEISGDKEMELDFRG